MKNVILLNLALRGLGRRQINVTQAAAANAVLSEVIGAYSLKSGTGGFLSLSSKKLYIIWYQIEALNELHIIIAV